MFIPLMKADAAQRRVYGSIDETLDRAGEILDYATAKPAFEAWSKTFVDATGGKSLGNIRAQHDLKKAAGKLVELEFDDDAKRISFCAEIVDDQEWAKVEAGVYTGFSPGGSYAKRWPDGMHKRYTPKVGELSIVDMPCIPSGTFTMVKADGAEEEIPFVLAKAYEPGNDATKTRSEELAKAAGKEGRGKDFVVQARADLIAENATAELAKMAEAELVVEEPAAAALLEASLAKADTALAPAAPEQPAVFADLTAAAAALRLISVPDDMAKSMWQVSRLADLIESFQCVAANIVYEANSEKDGSPQPAKAKEAMGVLGELLVMMAQEEVAEAIAGLPALEGAAITIVDGDLIIMELAASIVDMVKADVDLMEKAGARNSKGDAAKIQSMHDNSVALGATCDTSAEKAEQLAADNERLTKAVGEAAPRIEKLVERIGVLTEENKLLKAQPAPPKGVVLAVSKEDDSGLAKADVVAEDESQLPLAERARRAAIRLA